jgi:hypothetical protein
MHSMVAAEHRKFAFAIFEGYYKFSHVSPFAKQYH